MADYAIVFPFVDQSEAFAKGFEAGILYGKAQQGARIRNEPLLIDSIEQAKLIAHSMGFFAIIKPWTEDRCLVTFQHIGELL